MKVDRKARGPDTGIRVYNSHYVRQTRWGDVVQKWPKRRPVDWTPAELYTRTEWAYACSWASIPEPMSLVTAQNHSKGTQLLPRDILVMAMYGTLYEFTLPDGTITFPARNVSPNAQLVLDMITTVPGSMLYRAPIGWVQVPPGDPGQVLTYTGDLPEWQDYPALIFSDLTVLLRTSHAGLGAALVVGDTASIAADWSTPNAVSFKRAALTGDVSAAANSNALTIGARKVLPGMMPALTAASLLGRALGAGTGDMTALSIDEALEMLGTSVRGDVITRGASGWQRLAAGTSGQFLQTKGTAANAEWATPSGGGGVSTCDIQAFTTPGSFSGASGWQKPTGVKIVEVYVIGAGGGGASGRRGPTTENSAGGSGGGGGGFTWTRFLAADLPSSVDLVVGAKGAGHAGETVNATNGTAGGNGGDSYFGALAASAYFAYAQGGRAGVGGTTSPVTGGAGGSARQAGASGGTGNNVSTGGTATAPSTLTPTGGGGGAGAVATTRTTRDGGAGGAYTAATGFFASGHTVTQAAAGVGSTKTAAQNGSTPGYEIRMGLGGGGGWFNNDGTAGSGGTGAQPGGGGGGGGPSNNGNTSGAGGDGGDGAVYVISFY